MAIATDISLNNAVSLIEKGIGTGLERRIRDALMPHAESVVCEVAKQLCKDLKANMACYTDHASGDIRISLVINDDRHEV